MLIIRLQRAGKNRQPVFRVVLAEKQKSAAKKFLEVLGLYNPRSKQFTLKDQARLEHWLSKNVEVSPTVHNLLVGHGILKDGVKVKAWQPKKKEAAPAAAPAAEPVPAPVEAAPEPVAEPTPESESKPAGD